MLSVQCFVTPQELNNNFLYFFRCDSSWLNTHFTIQTKRGNFYVPLRQFIRIASNEEINYTFRRNRGVCKYKPIEQ